MGQGPEAGPCLACLRNSKRLEWLEGRECEMSLAWVAGAGGKSLLSTVSSLGSILSGMKSPWMVLSRGVAWSC